MKRPLLVFAICFFSLVAHSQRTLTPKEIYGVNCRAVVQIYVNESFSGVGFVISSDGRIVTANHVIATRESQFKTYATDIKVLISGQEKPLTAVPESELTTDQTNYDAATIKVSGKDMPHVELGKWEDVQIGDDVIVTPSLPGYGCLLLQGQISTKGSPITPLGPKPVNTIIFQIPIRNGFSGSPILNSKGEVVGIEDTKVFGISPALGTLRDQWQQTKSGGNVRVFGVDVAASFIDIINNLDQNLISGLGSGVSIEYAKKNKQ